MFAAADVAVLAKYAPQAAAGEEDRAAAARAAYARLFPLMQGGARNLYLVTRAAETA